MKYNTLWNENKSTDAVTTSDKDDLTLQNITLNENNENDGNKLRNIYAGIVKSNQLYEFDSCELICVTSGTKCVSGDNMSMNGKIINDW